MRNPDRYREKECKRCGNFHKKRGKFCSRACANRIPASEAKKRKLSEKITDYHRSENGEAASKRQSDWAAAINRYKHGYTTEKPEGFKVDDFYLELPKEIPGLRDNQFVEAGDIWEEI